MEGVKKLIREELECLQLIPGIEYNGYYNPICSICGDELMSPVQNNRETTPIPHMSVAICLQNLRNRLKSL